MFPEDVHLNILSFLGTRPRKRCWSYNKNKYRCKNKVKNSHVCIFCPTHEKARFRRPLYKPFEDLIYLVEKIGNHKPKDITILRCPPPPINIIFGYPNFPYI